MLETLRLTAHSPLGTLAVGIAAVLACLGVGSLVLRLLQARPPSYWFVPLALLVGVAIAEAAASLVLLAGLGVTGLRVLSILLLCSGVGKLATQVRKIPWSSLSLRGCSWIALIPLLSLSINLLVALAPSSKIDELYYHMLTTQRVIADGGLQPYHQPFESAIYPQMSYQVALSMLHIPGFIDAGNVLSWAIGASLVIFLVGAVAQITGSQKAGWLVGGIAAVGLYPSVWHVTNGPHALGDLAIVITVSLCLLPESMTGWAKSATRLSLICLAACCAATTKISLVPLALLISAIAVWKAGSLTGRIRAVTVATAFWTVFYLPLVVWSQLKTGSPLGMATASLFPASYFCARSIEQFQLIVPMNRPGAWEFCKTLAISASPGLILCLVPIVALARSTANFLIMALLFAMQSLLIALFLPEHFRFLGGLQFVALVMAAWGLSLSEQGRRWLKRSPILAIALCIPWLVIQAIYARPFIAVATGFTSRHAFLTQYVPLIADFEHLDKILPADAVIYVNDTRAPSVYSPRTVAYDVHDLPANRPVYCLRTDRSRPLDGFACDEMIYENADAIVQAFRTPGRDSVRRHVTVERCVVK